MTKILKPNSNRHKRVELWAKSIKDFVNLVRACAAGDGAICRNRKIVPYHGANPNTRNGARLRSPSPIMAPVLT